MDEAEHDPAAAYSLLIIRSIDSSQYPVGVDASDPSTPSIQTFREKRRQNFITIIRNLVENPENENFRRLRMSNKLVADLLELRFALNFFEVGRQSIFVSYLAFRPADSLGKSNQSFPTGVKKLKSF